MTIGDTNSEIKDGSARTHVERVNFAPQSRNSLPPPNPVAKVAGWLRHLIDPDQVVELRALGMSDVPAITLPDGTTREPVYAGRFRGDELEVIAREALALSGRCRGVYYTLNPLARFDRQAPRMQVARRSQLAHDTHVVRRTRLLIDIDPVKAAGATDQPASDAEHEAALSQAVAVRDYLTARGWPLPVTLDTGNGGQLVYRIDLPADSDLVRRVLYGLTSLNGAGGRVDTSVHNASRIARLPGPMNVKGVATADRPHRRCVALDAPAELLTVSEDMLAAVADQTPAEPERKPTPHRATRTAIRTATRTAGTFSGTDDRIEQARRYVAAMPGAIEKTEVDGMKGHDRTIYTAGRLIRGFALTPDQAFPLFAEWNRKCVPVWGDADLWHKLEDADKHPGGRGYLLKDDAKPSRVLRGYDGITAEEAKAIAAAPPEPAPIEPCAITAATEVREQLSPTCCETPIWFLVERMKTGRRGNVPFGCHRPDCRPCTSQKVYDEYNRTAAWLIHRTQPDHPEGQMVLVGAIVDSDRKDGLIEAVQRRGGLYNWTDTTDAEGCESYLSGPETTDAALKASKENSACLKSRTLFLALVPVGSKLPADLLPIPVAGALRAKGNALQNPPTRPEGTSRYRAWSQSHKWGEKPEQKVSEIKVKRPSLFGGRVTKEIVAAWGIGTAFHTQDRRIQGTPVGFDADSRVRNLVAELLLAGAGIDYAPNKDRVIDLGQHWLPILPADIGDGPRVEQVLWNHIWHQGLYSIEAELRAADEQDQAASAWQREGAAIIRDLKQQYKGREHEASELVRMLLA